LSRSEWEIAHFAFDAAEIASVAAADEAFLEYLVEHLVMKGSPVRRGE